MVRDTVVDDVNCGLGIDTGGTNTDAVIVDLRTARILAKAKARTTHHDLSIGLGEAVDKVREAYGKELAPNLVGVSTTLATNSILEGVGGQVGLIGLGWRPGPGEEFGTKHQVFLDGGHDVRGRVQTPLNPDAVGKAVEEMAPHVDSFVVSGLFSVYNPLHEVEVKRLIRERHDIPVVMGHDLTGELGFYERTVTAVLNARLLPVLDDFLQKVQLIMELRGIRAPIMVLKGDGNLMNISMGRERPVETLLSGPAASARGGLLLSGLEDCIAVDIGGTSTDIAVMEKGQCRVSKEGAVVGVWPTRVEAVNVRTVALGGDSEVKVGPKRQLHIGPERVVPLCFAKPIFPDLKQRMRETGETRFYMASPLSRVHLTPAEERIMQCLRDHGPQSMKELEERLEGIYLMERFLRALKIKGAVEGVALTPTDVLHVLGRYNEGDEEAAIIALQIIAGRLQMNEVDLAEKIADKVTSRIAEEVIKKMLADEIESLPHSEGLQELIDGLSGARSFANFSLRAEVRYPLVGLGGPAGAFMPQLAERLGVKVVIPEDHDVGNAIGAVCGQVSEFVDVFVCPRGNDYAIYSSFSPPITMYGEFDAMRKAKELASSWAMERAEKAGGMDLHVEMKLEEERERSPTDPKKDVLVQLWVRARAAGAPVDLRSVKLSNSGPRT